AVLPPDVVDREDVGMRERGDGARLALEARHRVGVAGGIGRQYFDGHVAAEARVAAAVNLPHPALADQRHDLVRTDAGAGTEHRGLIIALVCSSPTARFGPATDSLTASSSKGTASPRLAASAAAASICAGASSSPDSSTTTRTSSTAGCSSRAC